VVAAGAVLGASDEVDGCGLLLRRVHESRDAPPEPGRLGRIWVDPSVVHSNRATRGWLCLFRPPRFA
jgi:hypothetical protein